MIEPIAGVGPECSSASPSDGHPRGSSASETMACAIDAKGVSSLGGGDGATGARDDDFAVDDDFGAATGGDVKGGINGQGDDCDFCAGTAIGGGAADGAVEPGRGGDRLTSAPPFTTSAISGGRGEPKDCKRGKAGGEAVVSVPPGAVMGVSGARVTPVSVRAFEAGAPPLLSRRVGSGALTSAPARGEEEGAGPTGTKGLAGRPKDGSTDTAGVSPGAAINGAPGPPGRSPNSSPESPSNIGPDATPMLSDAATSCADSVKGDDGGGSVTGATTPGTTRKPSPASFSTNSSSAAVLISVW